MASPLFRLPNRLADQRGSTLLLCIFILLILTVLGMASTQTSSLEINLAANERDYQQAIYAAEAGISHMRALLQNNMISGNQVNLASESPVDWDFALQPPAMQISNGTLDRFTYNVTVRDNDDGDANLNRDDDRLIFVTSVATGPNNSTATVEVALRAAIIAESLSDYSAQAGGGTGKTNTSSDVSAIDVTTANENKLNKL